MRPPISQLGLAIVATSVCASLAFPALALTRPSEPGRFDALTRELSGAFPGVRAVPTTTLPDSDPLQRAWNDFVVAEGGGWSVWIDERSGLPTLALGRGVPWIPGAGNGLPTSPGTEPGPAELEALARAFLERHTAVLGDWDGQLVFDGAASAPLGGGTWQVVFRQRIDGVPVDGARYTLHLSRGNLVALGATRWARVRTATAPSITREQARGILDEYLGVGARDAAAVAEPLLHLVPVDPAGGRAAAWTGGRGAGYDHRLLWRFELRVPGESPTWVAEVDGHAGTVVALRDATRYDRIQGGVLPLSNDGDCPSGCEQPDYPMPFVDYTEDGGAAQATGAHGLYECGTIGAIIETNLTGPYVTVNDTCGPISETATCDNALDLGTSPGGDCTVAGGASAGNTRASRSSYYHLNFVAQKGRAWLPSNNWLREQLVDNVNIDSSCNAFYDGTVNFYTSGNDCANTGELQGVVVHEWGHGLDEHDGGGFDNPSEAYSDIMAIFESRESCMGRGFYETQNCDGYGNGCLSCDGFRDLDWAQRQFGTPSTPSDFVRDQCPSGIGPCGAEDHCEGYVAGETLWDLAVRDLPAAGLDADSAWQLAEKLWYRSRKGSGGDAYNCSNGGLDSDGCGTSSWFHKLRLIDDDDGNLANGTPHAAAIFAAFDRHDIACGLATDASNQSTSSCPTLAQPVITSVQGLSNAVELTWSAVPSAATYTILRNDLGCARGQTIVGQVAAPTTSFIDTDLADGFTVHYRVQATAANDACDSPVSACTSGTPQPLAGIVRFDRGSYPCGGTVGLSVRDANVSGPTVTVSVRSDSEPTPEVVVLTETVAGSGRFVGQIPTSGAPPAPDGVLSTAHGDQLDVEYVDADDGQGGTNVTRQHTATVDCVLPVISNVRDANIGTNRAEILWDTDEIADSIVRWGETAPPAQTTEGNPRTTSHETELTALDECRVYLYQVEAPDPAGNTAVDDNGGAYYTFETLGDFGAGPQSCHTGRVNVGDTLYSCASTVTFTVSDTDLNQDPAVAETVTVRVTSTTETSPEIVTLTEVDVDDHVFSGSIATATGIPLQDGVLQAGDGDVLTISYRDASDEFGQPALSFATADLDCAGPVITDLRMELITNARTTPFWTTDELSDSVVEWGPTSALGNVATGNFDTMFHSTLLNQFDICEEFHFRIKSTDAEGNTTVADFGGTPFVFRTWDIPGLYWRETFESGGAGWTLGGEWEIGPTQGLGGSSGPSDPPKPYNNSAIMGHDLTGLGAFPGDYEPLIDESATSPPQDASTWTNTKLVYHRRLQTGSGDEGSLSLWADGQRFSLFRSFNLQLVELQYNLFSNNVASFADGKSSVFLEFQQTSGPGVQFGGWNVDDVIFKDGSLPDFAPCGGCTTAPAFAGAVSAVDNDACGTTGVTVSWERAVTWGTGGDGSYAVYRDTSPGFVPSAANLIAAGVTTLSYDDVAAPTDQTLYYLVRAENDETCSGGPANGGLIDANAVYVSVQESTSQPVPPAVETLRGKLVGLVHPRLEWDAVTAGTRYRLFRSTDRQGPFTQLDETTELFWEDVGAGPDPGIYYYQVRAVNACNIEGP